MIIQLREYESGEYGLAEAVSEIKELRQQRRIRDRQIEELVQASNKLQADASQLEEQNLALRHVSCVGVLKICSIPMALTTSEI
jgi:centrosomal protein CEP290